MPDLVVVLPPGPTARGDAVTADEVLEIRGVADRWPGRVGVVVPRTVPEGDLTELSEASAALGVDVLAGDPVAGVQRLGADVVRLPLDPRLLGAARAAPSVVTARTTAVQALRHRGSRGPALWAPAAVRAARELWTARSVLEASDGLQCDGWGAWAVYHEQAQMRHRVPPLLTFGSHLRVADVERGRSRLRSRPPVSDLPRLAFVGRLHPADGPQYAIAASRHLDRWGVPHELVVLGEGPLEAELRERAGSSVRFAGPVEPGPWWHRAVVQETDLAILPYLHARPTGVELELAGTGVPVAGFRSATLEGHRRFAGFTATARPRSARSLAGVVRRLVTSPERMQTLATRGVGFMGRHNAEARWEAEVEHLLRVAGTVPSPR